ncbi:MAG: glycosyl hydrolase 53 family protein [Oscillospiraceae bacterium]|nr:glycosyl hydrolase 53 family protein [Oscillospiraceae bacterium]
MKIFASFTAVLTAAALLFWGATPLQTTYAYEPQVQYTAFPAEVNGGEPIRGVDVSSVIAIEQAGVVFHDDDGNEANLFQVLYDHDVNYIRVRVWNEPNDGSGHSYGGGNNDVQTACEIAKRASKYGMKLLVDIQYSDFWADPAKQQRPKYWANHDHSTLAGEIYKWTSWVLTAITEAGGDIGMVQVGNETNCHFCGETDMYQICDLFKSGDKAVRDFDRSILIAHHFANPSNAEYYYWYAKVMQECGVDYDVFATSYYPYWHGATQNLTNVLKTIGNTYGKYVMVAETAYPYTSEDGDTFGNAISADSADADFQYAISVEGQAQCLTDVFQAVADCGSRGIGVFYWEPAWLGVPKKSWQEQNALWKQYGSGWATDYAAGYDPDADAAGGSSYDNQALFNFDGYPLASLDAFTGIYPKQEKQEITPSEPHSDLRTVEFRDRILSVEKDERICFTRKGDFRLNSKELHLPDGRPLPPLKPGEEITIRFTYHEETGDIIKIELFSVEHLPGDVNADGECTVSDAVLFSKWLHGIPQVILTDGEAGDLNGDGSADVFDLALLRQELLL